MAQEKTARRVVVRARKKVSPDARSEMPVDLWMGIIEFSGGAAALRDAAASTDSDTPLRDDFACARGSCSLSLSLQAGAALALDCSWDSVRLSIAFGIRTEKLQPSICPQV